MFDKPTQGYDKTQENHAFLGFSCAFYVLCHIFTFSFPVKTNTGMAFLA